ncbi:hypothetical protein [Candidatus Aalborgicola defluviihabitans]|jgi:hypothetical protein|uniref:hypothetical protein n=1 Tax=Candidatus Aalborgicola defluviihabitans TaxID=3386187 RepID=UPI001E036A39|nr:hypothetical protein [Burkholderiales bacterium]MBK6569352.1 hypothetical protein [Burkholderiales bacterium]MBK7280770.1 hypothetical protein [Burkholderiales bacterium]MBK7315957.1 hypothetical protein [Burkholderiales bacterium]MBL0243948.1 hypothetical protein [Rhodoferax sp.]
MSKMANGLVAVALMAATVAQADYVSGYLGQRDAMYMYGMNVTQRVSKEFWGINCDVFQVVFKMDTGSTDFRYVQTNSSAVANTLSARTWFPDTIFSYQSPFAYNLSNTATYKVYGFESGVYNGNASIGRGTFFAYCFSTNPNAYVFLWDGESCRIKYSNGSSVASVCM